MKRWLKERRKKEWEKGNTNKKIERKLEFVKMKIEKLKTFFLKLGSENFDLERKKKRWLAWSFKEKGNGKGKSYFWLNISLKKLLSNSYIIPTSMHVNAK